MTTVTIILIDSHVHVLSVSKHVYRGLLKKMVLRMVLLQAVITKKFM